MQGKNQDILIFFADLPILLKNLSAMTSKLNQKICRG